MRRLLLVLTISLATLSPTFAVQPDEILPDAAMEARARGISSGLRCLVCQNQSIDDSDAPLARDLRLLVRERLKAGDDDNQVRAFLVQRYGEFVLLKPPLSGSTIILWLAPLLILLGAITWVWRNVFPQIRATAGSPQVRDLTPDERAKLDALMAEAAADNPAPPAARDPSPKA